MITDELLEQARVVSRRLGRRMPGTGIHVDELYSAALMGLVDASGRYDPGKGASFKTFAEHRMYGSCRDLMRANVLVAGTNANKAGVTMQPIESAKNVACSVKDALQLAIESQATLRVRKAIQQLTGKSRRALWLLYVEGHTTEQVASILCVHTSRVRQYVAQSAPTLRALLG